MDSQSPTSERLSFLISQVRIVADCLVCEQSVLLESDLSDLSLVVEKKVAETATLSDMLLEWETQGPGWAPDSPLFSSMDREALKTLKHELSLLSELATVNMILAQESGQMLTSLVRTLNCDSGQFHTYNPSGGLGGVSTPGPTLVSTRT